MSIDDIQIRHATHDDLERVITFNLALAAETEDKTLDLETLRAGVLAALSGDGRAQYFVAQVDGRVVGQTMFTTEWSDWRNGFFWWIQSVYVDAGFRGRGVFRALYERIRSLACQRSDVCGIRLYVDKHNARAIETYEKLGMALSDYLVCEECWPGGDRHTAH